MSAKASKWLPLFREFIKDLRISSKEESTADGSGTKLELWDSQRLFLENVAYGLDDGVRIFKCLKSRQLGITTISLAIDIFWLAMHPGLTGALVTENEANRDKNRKVLRQYVESFPEGYFGEKFGIKGDNRQHISFTNGSRLDFKVAGTKDKGTAWAEGEGYAFAHLTETASYGSADGLRSFEEAFAQKNPNRLYIYESTAKGFNIWRDSWLAGFSDPSMQRSFFIGWWASATNRIERDDPRFLQYGLDKPTREERELLKAVKEQHGYEISEQQIAWYRWREHNGGDGAMLQQNQPWTAEQAFISSGQSFFPTRQITKDLDRITRGQDPADMYLAYRYSFGETFFSMKLHAMGEEDDASDIELRVWEEPARDGKYVIGCDPAWGRTEHGDRTCVSVWRCYADKIVQVAEYASNQTEVKYVAWILAHLSGAYGDCIVNVELGGGGRIIMHEWEHLKAQMVSNTYANVVQANGWEDALANARWYLYNRPDSMGAGYAYNFECLGLDTPLPTPSGWTTMGDLQEGDFLLSDEGKPTQVLGVSEVKTGAKCYEICFDDGTRITADEDHWWKVARRHWKDGDKMRQTKQLEAGKFYIRQAKALTLPEADLPVDPYILGAWLGDGSSTGACIYSGHEDVDEMIRILQACGQPTTKRVSHPGCWGIGLNAGNQGSRGNPLMRKFRELNVLGNKHIPPIYLRGSFEQRLSLLQGLMDTDGCSGGNGGPQCSFVTTIPALADGFSELLRSLGFKAKKIVFEDHIEYKGVRKACKLRHQFWFTAYPEVPVFRLGRKAERLKFEGRRAYRKPCHRIKSIREVESVPVKCVMVDSPSKMFLAGEGMIPTHNTSWRTKQELMHGMRGSYITKELDVRSKPMLMEMTNVVQDGSTIGAPDSRDGDMKDDRVFAAAFAHRAWVNWRRADMLAQGMTWEHVRDLETGTATQMSRSINGMVQRFWKHAIAQGEMEEDPRPTWRIERGL